MADYPDILKREHLTNEERKCICNQLKMCIRDSP